MGSPGESAAQRELRRLVAQVRKRSPVVSRRGHDEFSRLFRTWFPVGHFYSPYPDLDDLAARADTIFARDVDVEGVDMREAEQLELFGVIAAMADDLPFSAEPDGRHRYHFDNKSYGWSDGIVLNAMLRHLEPARIIEVGSGFSSAMILDTVERWLDRPDGQVQLRFIEPHPELLHSLLRPADHDRVAIDAKPVQQVPLEVYDELQSGDVLFIDSTHVAKAGSDVNHLFFHVLPRLAPGVWVHIHDIFMPFEYPLEWIREGRAWQEAYLLRAFLMYNTAFEIRWFQNYMWTKHQLLIEGALPQMAKNAGGNIWLQKTGSA